MDWSAGDRNLYYSSICSDSPSVRLSTSRHASRLLRSAAGTVNSFSLDQSIKNTSHQRTNQSSTSLSFLTSAHESTLFNEDSFRIPNQSVASFLNEQPYQTAQAGDKLFESFLEANQKFSTIGDLCDLLNEYEEICKDNLAVTMTLNRNKVREVIETKQLTKLENLLKLERNSWRLAKILFNDRVTSGLDEEEEMQTDAVKKMSDKALIEHLFEKNTEIRQMQLVIDWLEQNEMEDLEDGLIEKVEFYSEGPHAWENTLHNLKKQKLQKGKSYSLNRELCSEMDPDASIRSQKSLQDLDKEDESRLFTYIFRLLRAGQLQEAKATCERLGYHWLSATLDGWLLYNDPNYENDHQGGNELLPPEGNANRDLWKSVCWSSSTMDGVLIYERAIYAVLSGNVATVLPLCPRWSDKLWAFSKCALDVLIENELRATLVPNPENRPRHTVELPDAYWENGFGIEAIFREVDAIGGNSPTVEDLYHQVVCKFLILNDVDSLLDHVHEWIKTLQKMLIETNSELTLLEQHQERLQNRILSPHMLRFFAHLILYFRQLDRTKNREELCNTILEAYITYLIDTRQINLVAYYASHLAHRNQIICYAKLLESIEEKSDRQLCLQHAQNAGLDIDAITRTVVEVIRTKPVEEISTELTSRTSVDDKRKIDALDWLLYNDALQLSEALKQCNALMRYFVLSRKVDAAKEAFYKLPADIIDGIAKTWRRKTGRNEMSEEDENATREYLCFKTYYQANDAFNDWMQCYHNSKPLEPNKPTSNRFAEKVAYEHKKRQFESELLQWQEMLIRQGKLTADKIYNVLLFPDGGWMNDRHEVDNETQADRDRQHQLEMLRKSCIPQLTFILHSVLHSSNSLKECLQISDVIADRRNYLYREFSREQLQDLMKKFRETSIALLTDYPDPLGYMASE